MDDDHDVNPTRSSSSRARRAAAKPVTPPRRVECIAVRTLLSVARQRRGHDAPRCQLVFEHLDAAIAVRSALQRTLSEYRVSELQFAVLVALFALDPEPVTPADLADYTAVTRAAITDALVRLEALRLVSRARDQADRRVFHLQLTEQGRTTVDEALNRYLAAVASVARYIEPSSQPDVISACQRLQRGAAELTS